MTYNVAPNLVDPDADPAAKSLYAYLVGQIGKKIITGQTDQNSFEVTKTTTGSYPLLRGYDMQHYSPQYSYLWDGTAINPNNGTLGYFSFGPDLADPSVSNAINWYNSNGKKPIIEFHWHWHSPSGGVVGKNTFYTDSTTFDVSEAVTSGTAENVATLHDIDAIAVQLKTLRDAGVPIIWRPLHEASGTWFWWSAKGAGNYKALWNIMYERLVNYHGLHNLIWTWTGDDAAWYPGNDKVDILGIDAYPGNFNYTINKVSYDKIYNISGGTKLLALTENGPIPDIDQALNNGAPWAFFMSWYDVKEGNDNAHLVSVFGHPDVVTLENYH